MERPDQRFDPPASMPLDEPAGSQPAAFGRHGPSRAAIAALQAHPSFPAAARMAAKGFVDLWQGNRFLNILMSDRGRFLMSLFAVYLHRLSRPDDPHSGLTVSRMTALCAEQKFSSPGRAKAMLMLMRAFGFVAPAPGESDRRLRRLVPTERLMDLHRERNRRVFEAIAMVLPECAEAIAAQSDRDFTPLYVCRYCEQFLTGFRLIDAAPQMRIFVDRNAGLMIQCGLLLAAEADDTYPPIRPVTISASALSRRFGVSRAHVRRLLQDAENQGLLQRLEGDRIRPLSPLRQGTIDLMAVHFLLVAHCAQSAFADLRRQAAVS